LNSPQQFQVIVAVHHSGTIREILLYRLNDLIGPYVFMPQVSGTFMLGLAAAKNMRWRILMPRNRWRFAFCE